MPQDMMLTLVALFAAVALTVFAASDLIGSATAPGRRRVRRLATGQPATPVQTQQLFDQPGRGVERLAGMVPRSPKELGRLRRRLTGAGYRSARAAVIFSAVQCVLPVALALVPLLWFGFQRGLLYALLAGIAGYLLPELWLERRTAKRRKQIQNGLPDALDLLIVCLEAGCSVDQAVVKASQELAITYPALADELNLFTTEVRAGKPRLEAWKNLAARTRVEDVRALVAMLVQTDRFGTSIAQALRTHADAARTLRRQRAEERAAKVSVKLVFPLVFCLFPAFYVVVLGPAIIQYVRVFKAEIVP